MFPLIRLFCVTAIWFSAIPQILGHSRRLQQRESRTEVVETEGELRERVRNMNQGSTRIVIARDMSLTETLVINASNVSIRGDKSGTLLHCPNGTGSAVHIRGENVKISSLEFSHCRGHSAVVVEFPRGRDSSRAVVTFRKVEFIDNAANHEGHRGGAVRATARKEDALSVPKLRFLSCHFIKNQAAIGGAVFAQDVDVSIRQSLFRNNSAMLAGGALYIDSARKTNVRIHESNFTNNEATREGEAPNAANASLGIVTGMQSVTGKGGAVFVGGAVGLNVAASDFKDNRCCRGGGGIASVHHRTPWDNQTQRILNVAASSFQNNSALCGQQEDALYMTSNADMCCVGGAMLVESLDETSVEAHLRHSTFVENDARGGGAVSFRSAHQSSAEHRVDSCQFRGNVGVMVGGAAMLTRCRVSVMNSTFVLCKSAHGGAFYNLRSTLIFAEHPDDPLAKSVIEENSASSTGGGIHSHVDSSLHVLRELFTSCCRVGSLNLTALIIRNNTAYRGNGGGLRILNTDDEVLLRGIRVENNRAVAGGGMSILGASHVSVTSSDRQRTIIESNTAAVGGGIDYETGESFSVWFTVEDTDFVANRALSASNPEITSLVRQSKVHASQLFAGIKVPDVEDRLGPDFTPVSFRSHASEGHGGGISLALFNVRPFAVVEILFKNLSITDNKAIVGGGVSAEMKDILWNEGSERVASCFPHSPGFDVCQKFEFRHVNVTKNKAQFAGGVYLSNPNGIVAACGPTEEAWSAEANYAATDPSARPFSFCSIVEGNTDERGIPSDAGTRAVALHIEGGSTDLRQVASGDFLAMPRPDGSNASYDDPPRVHVKDIFNHTITKGIEDASLELDLMSDAIVGDVRYKAENGIAFINNTRAWGISQNSTLTIVSERNRNINTTLRLTTRECYPGEIVRAEVCYDCPVDQYSCSPTHDDCYVCEKNAECPGGAVLIPAEGYWHSTPFSPVFHKCIYAEACRYDDRREGLAKFYDDVPVLRSLLEQMNTNVDRQGIDPDIADYQQCSEGYEGPLCGSCQDGYGHSYNGQCEKCPEEQSTTGSRLFLTVLWLFVLIGVNCTVTLISTGARVALVKYEKRLAARNERRTLQRSPPVSNSAVRSAMLHGQSGTSADIEDMDAQLQSILEQELLTTVVMTETLKMLINYLQVTGAAVRLQMEWNRMMEALLQFHASLVGSLTTFVFTPYECNFGRGGVPASIAAMWMRLSTPWIVLVALALIFTLLFLLWQIRIRLKRTMLQSRFSPENFATSIVIICIVSMQFSYIDVVRELMRAINCVPFDVGEEISPEHPYLLYATEAVEKKIWVEDTALECYEGPHRPIGILGIVGLVFSLGGIITIILWLPLNKKRRTRTTFVSRYWFIYQAYRGEWYTVAWESMVLSRKCMIAAAVVFSVHMNPILQASVCTGILTVALALQAMFSPFKETGGRRLVPEYTGDIFYRLHLPKLAKRWVDFNNAVNLNVMEAASLASSASVFYSAIVLQDDDCSPLGRIFVSVLSLVANVLFFVYIVFRLYAGLHVFLDLKLQANNSSFLATYDNSIGLLSLLIKLRMLIQTLRGATVESDETDEAEERDEIQLSLRVHPSRRVDPLDV